MIRSISKTDGVASLSPEAAQHRRKGPGFAQVSDSRLQPFHILFPLPRSPHPRAAGEIRWGQEASIQPSAPSEGQLLCAAAGGSGGCGGFDLFQAPK